MFWDSASFVDSRSHSFINTGLHTIQQNPYHVAKHYISYKNKYDNSSCVAVIFGAKKKATHTWLFKHHEGRWLVWGEHVVKTKHHSQHWLYNHRHWPWRTDRGWCGGRCCVPYSCHRTGGTAARSVRAAGAKGRWVADTTHILWAEGHPGKGHLRGRRAWSGRTRRPRRWWVKPQR